MSSTDKITLSENQRILIGVLLSILSGAFLFLFFPPFKVWPLAWVFAIPYLAAQYRFMPSRWARLAPTITFLLWLWPFLYRIFNIEGAPFIIQHMGLLVAVITFFTSTDRNFQQLTNYRWFILYGVFGWVGFEMIRSFIPMLGTMGFIANPLAGQPWLIQPVSVFSIYGLNLLIVFFNFSLAQVTLHWVDRKFDLQDTTPVDGQAGKRWLAGSAIAVAVWVALSLVILNQGPGDAPVLRAAALHMDIDEPGHVIDESVQEARFQEFLDLAHQAAGDGAQLIFVTEMAFGFDPQESHTQELLAFTAETNAYLYFTYAYHDDTGWHNETVLISPEGEFSPIYGKLHPAGEPPIATAGTFPVHQTPLGIFGSIICMDGVYTDAARYVASSGAQILGLPSYDTTVGISEQNWTHFVMRSVENQVPVVNADRGYYSMITDSHGRILADLRTPEGSSGVVIADVPLSTGGTIYQYLGDWLGWASLAGFVFFMFYQARIEKQAKQAQQEE